jgi:hypothetical protein
VFTTQEIFASLVRTGKYLEDKKTTSSFYKLFNDLYRDGAITRIVNKVYTTSKNIEDVNTSLIFDAVVGKDN